MGRTTKVTSRDLADTELANVFYTYKTGNGRFKEMVYANGDRMKASYNSAGQLVAERWYDLEMDCPFLLD